MANKLNEIEDNHYDDMEKCCSEVMEYWLNNFEATWNKMTHALNHIDQLNQQKMLKEIML